MEDLYKYYKESTIIDSIEKAEKHNLVDGYLFAGDVLDFYYPLISYQE